MGVPVQFRPGSNWGNLISPLASKDAESPSNLILLVLLVRGGMLNPLKKMYEVKCKVLTLCAPSPPPPPPNRTNRIRLLGLSAFLLAGGEIRLPQLLPGPGQYRPCKAKPQLMSNTGAYIPFTGGGAMPAISSAMPGA